MGVDITGQTQGNINVELVYILRFRQNKCIYRDMMVKFSGNGINNT